MDKTKTTPTQDNIPIEKISYEAMLQNIIDFIKQKYEPVTDLSEADINISLKDIYYSIQEFYPIPHYSESDIMTALLTAGFKYDAFGDLNFYWKMRIRG